MPSILDRAKEREARKLGMHGMKADGSPIDPNAGPSRGPRLQMDRGPEPGDDDYIDPDDLVGDRQQQRQTTQQQQRTQAEDDPVALKAELAQVRQELAALNGRVAPAQRDAEDFKRLWQTEQTARQTETQRLQQERDELLAKLEQRDTEASIEELLTPDELRDIDPTVLKAMTKIADSLAKRRAPKIDARGEAIRVLDEREAQRVVRHRSELMSDPTRNMSKLAQLAYDPEFITWSKEEDNDVEAVMNSFLAAKSTEEVDRYARIVEKRITKFRERNKQNQQATDPRASLSQHMRRGEQPRITDAQRAVKLQEAKNLSRSRNPADRQKARTILDELG